MIRSRVLQTQSKLIPKIVRCATFPSSIRRRTALVALMATLALSGCSTSLSNVPLVGAPPTNTDEASRLSDLLLTLAQINGTVLAFVLGLSLLTYQLLAQRSLRRFPLGGLQIATFVSYLILGVVAPLAIAVRPTDGAAIAITGISVLFILATPLLAVRAARSGLPRSVARGSMRHATKRRFRAGAKKAAVIDAAETIALLRDGSTSTADRVELQSDLQSLCLLALSRNHEEEAATIALACVGEADSDAVRRLEQLDGWYRSNATHLASSERVAKAIWTALVNLCRIARDDEIDLLRIVGVTAEGVASSRVVHIMRASPRYEPSDSWHLPPFSFSLTRYMDDSPGFWLKEAAELALLLSERAAPRRRDRLLFETICNLLEKPGARITLCDSIEATACFKSADRIFRHTIKDASRDHSEIADEIKFRIERLAEVPIRILEGATKESYLASDATRQVYFGYLEWLETAAVESHLWVVSTLESSLQRATRSTFLGQASANGRVAAKNDVSIVMRAAAKRLARLSLKLHQRWTLEGWSRDDLYLMFDPSYWLPDTHRDSVAASLLPALDRELWPDVLQGIHDEPLRLGLFELDDQIGQWFRVPERADVYIGVLLGRWSRSWQEDHKRTLLSEHRESEHLPRIWDQAEPESKGALDHLSNSPTSRRPRKVEARVLRELALLDTALNATFSYHYLGRPDEVETATRWKECAQAWMLESPGDNQRDPRRILSSTFPSAIPALPRLLAAATRDETAPHLDAVRSYIWQSRFERAPTVAVREYFLLPVWEGSSHGYVVALEEDRSSRLVVLEDRDEHCQALTPFSRKYLPGLLIDDWIGDWVRCQTCLATSGPYVGLATACPSCGGSTKSPDYAIICDAVFEFIQTRPALGVAPDYSQLPHAFSGIHQDSGGRLRSFKTDELLHFLRQVLGPEASGREESNTDAGPSAAGHD